MKRKYTILLTACVNVNAMSHTKLVDAEIRRQQYIGAVKYYLINTKYSVVICNNSGDDFPEFKDYEGERFEYLYYDGNNYNRTLGKGYGEFEIIKYALQNSRLINESRNVIKITGRLIISNLKEILRYNNLLMCWNSRKLYINATFNKIENKPAVDSKCFICPTMILRNMFLQQNEINDSKQYYMETYLYDYIQKHQSGMCVCGTFAPFVVNGFSGTFNTPYETICWNTYQKFYYARNFCEVMKCRGLPPKKLNYIWLTFFSWMFYILKKMQR